MAHPQKLLSVEEAAALLGAKPSTIRRKILERKIGYHKLGKSFRISAEEVEALITTSYRPPIAEKEGRS